MSDHVSYTSESYAPSGIVAGNTFLLLAEKLTIAAGQDLTAGAILGIGAASKAYLASANDLAGDPVADGRGTPYAILAHDTNAVTDTTAMAYIRGDFIASACYHDDSLTAATVKAALRDLNIYLVPAE